MQRVSFFVSIGRQPTHEETKFPSVCTAMCRRAFLRLFEDTAASSQPVYNMLL